MDKQLVAYIKESRKRGFEDFQIREHLLKNSWPAAEVEEAFIDANDKNNESKESKERITLFLDKKILDKIEKRAKKNMLSVHDQIFDILRRSCLSSGKSTSEEKLDDRLVAIFSRKR